MTSPAKASRATSPRRPGLRVAVGSGLFGSVATTAMANITAVATAGGAGIIIARALGPTFRGEYAAVIAWFGVALVLGDLGQAAATTFFVARDSPRASDYVATSRTIMAISGTAVAAVGLLAVPVLPSGSHAMAWGYRLAFLTCLASLVGASYTAALQATSLRRWNLVRTFQPSLFVAVVAVLYLAERLTFMTALAALSLTVVARTALTLALCRNQGLTGGRADLGLARPMTHYGLSQLAGSTPTVLTARLDQLVLSLAATPAALGHYAVAVSLTGLAVPVVSAAGQVSFPRLASQALSGAGMHRLQRGALLTSASIGTTLMLALGLGASWLVPAVFGAGYRDAVPLVWLLAPGGVFLACGQVCGDLLNGRGRPLVVARAQGAAAAATILLLAALVPAIGVAGAALASSAATGVALLIMLRAIHPLSTDVPPALSRGGER
jgi:O-antigen/teichoic acid export membrane protein